VCEKGEKPKASEVVSNLLKEKGSCRVVVRMQKDTEREHRPRQKRGGIHKTVKRGRSRIGVAGKQLGKYKKKGTKGRSCGERVGSRSGERAGGIDNVSLPLLQSHAKWKCHLRGGANGGSGVERRKTRRDFLGG